MILTDAAVVQGARITRDGYLVADALVARANNIQTYRASELGLTDRQPSDQVRIFRPEAEVFHKDALASAAHRPITLDHPPEMVDAKNWKQFAKGDMGGEVIRDGEFVRVSIKMMDAQAVDSVLTDRREFSLGYVAEIDMTPGVFDGQAYDGSLSQIRYNHLAACKTARGGAELRITDERRDDARHLPERTPMKTITFDGLPVTDVSPAAEAVIGKLQGSLTDAVTAKDAAETKVVELTAQAALKDAEIAKLTKAVEDAKVTPAQMRDAARGYAKTAATAKALGATITDDMDEPAIKKAVVAAKLGDTAKDWNDEHIAVAFATLTKDIKDADPIRNVIRDGLAPMGDARTQAEQAWKAQGEDLNAWRTKAA